VQGSPDEQRRAFRVARDDLESRWRGWLSEL
jgi:hypothetical protein